MGSGPLAVRTGVRASGLAWRWASWAVREGRKEREAGISALSRGNASEPGKEKGWAGEVGCGPGGERGKKEL